LFDYRGSASRSHLEEVGAAEEQEVDPGQRREVFFTQGGTGQQRRRKDHLSQGVGPLGLEVNLRGGGYSWGYLCVGGVTCECVGGVTCVWVELPVSVWVELPVGRWCSEL